MDRGIGAQRGHGGQELDRGETGGGSRHIFGIVTY